MSLLFPRSPALGFTYLNEGENPDAALPFFLELIELLREGYVPDDPNIFERVLFYTGDVYFDKGDFSTAAPYFEVALAMRRRTSSCPASDIGIAQFTLSLGRANFRLGMERLEEGRGREYLQEALALFEESLAVRRAQVPSDPSRICEVLQNVAAASGNLGLHQKAMPCLKVMEAGGLV